VLVQGEQAPEEIVAALKRVNESDTAPDVVVMVRGGGSADDLAAWSDERVVRAVAASRVPTLVAIGHEIDVSLAELAADRRASTPSNAAELLLPDRKEELRHLRAYLRRLDEQLMVSIMRRRTGLVMLTERLDEELRQVAQLARQRFTTARALLAAYDPVRPLAQGYALVQTDAGKTVTRAAQLRPGSDIAVKFIDGKVASQVKTVHTNKE
jgi:exodeoxyribonuclease VII large subunit